MRTISEPPQATLRSDSTEREFARRLDEFGWGAFLLMTGVLWLLSYAVPSGTWLIGTGILLLALNGVRYYMGVPLHRFTVALGALALAAGLADLFDVRLPILAAAFVVFGVLLLIKPFTTHRGNPRGQRA